MDISVEQWGLIVSIIVSGVACLTSIHSARVAASGLLKSTNANRAIDLLILEKNTKHERDLKVSLYKEPLIKAAADLQSRIYNIINLNFLGTYYVAGDVRRKNYAINNTVFLFAQFFAWTEATRCEIQFINLDNDVQTRDLQILQNDIYSLMQTDSFNPILMVFAGEQRAMGEKMLKPCNGGVRCIGYGEYLERNIQRDDVLIKLFSEDVRLLADNLELASDRLIKIQHALIDLLLFLDSEHYRIPKEKLSKI